jgi:hypothetical protein
MFCKSIANSMSGDDKVFCPQCQTKGRRSKVILYPGQTVPKMKFTDGYWKLSSLMLRLSCRGISAVMDMSLHAVSKIDRLWIPADFKCAAENGEEIK